jgi:lysophospholipase L1-like esterase
VAASATRVLLLGDSIAWSIGSGWYNGSATPPSDASVLLLNRGRYFCHVDSRPSRDVDGTVREEPNACPDWRSDWANAVADFQPDLVILPMSLWTVLDRKIDGSWVDWWDARYQRDLESLYEEAVGILTASGAKLVLLSTAPQDANGENAGVRPEQNRRLASQNEMAKRIAAANPATTTFVDLSEWACPAGECRSVGGLALRPDGLHYSATGSAAIAAWLEPQLLSLEKPED